ncbi:MAG: Iron-regulated ABC transporter membrane component SufB [Candidatus Collierbacteria bacterium GW2011_GWC2_43_12]|uniref:Iron-regulated ABC transporter membrane component SufB n=1 Tax=Candidatus Collierbacteria bacterium GW2011_GWC2_43_12 TaxID=1618390 RepID=A0A0G1FCA1_9BACT|nr:MAG: Iron-regulated ABC transporter membrane component SufB [Candidatus Collierbacteria bacterium GW2011_GWC2_43_12]
MDNTYPLGHSDIVEYSYMAEKGLTEELVRGISAMKQEPEWMLEIRLKALKKYREMPMPTWGGDFSPIDFEDIRYYIKPKNQEVKTWAEVPEAIKNTFEKIGVPEAEREMLAGVKSQYDSEVVYGSLKKALFEKGIIFLSMDEGLKQYPEIVKEYFGKVIPMGDNKLAALNTAVWSGGSFVYVPKGVDVGLPLQAYFRINTEKAGQFERTLIIAEEGSSSASLHAAVVEIYVKKNAKVQYSTVQNWYKNVYNLVTKRARVEENAVMRWVDGNLGSHLTMKYPSCVLVGRKAHGEVLSIAWAGEGQHQDTGAKMIHLAPETTSQIISKSISKGGGRATYRGMVHMVPGAWGSRSKVVCDALILDEKSRSDTYPVNKIQENDVVLEHEATVSRVSEEQLLYLQSRGISAEEASTLIVNGFMEPVVKEIPLEYAVEMNRLVELEMEGSVG